MALMLDQDTDALVDEVFILMQRLPPSDSFDRVTDKGEKGKHYLLALGLNADEWDKNPIEEFKGKDTTSNKAHQLRGTGKKIWEHKMLLLKSFMNPDKPPSPELPTADRGKYFDKAAWKEFHRAMVTSPGSNVDITRLRKQLEGERDALTKYIVEIKNPNRCAEELFCC